jgi:CheY-like chemotaxis protein
MNPADQSPDLLLVEDDSNDVLLFKTALKRTGIACRLNVATDGEEAIDYLSGNNQFSDRKKYPFPDIVILDIKMPRKSGIEVLEWIRDDWGFQDLCVVMLSSSNLEVDHQQAQRFGVVGYFVKPINNEQLSGMIKDWLRASNRSESTQKENG